MQPNIGSHAQQTAATNSSPISSGNGSWMSHLDDEKLISEFTIPGTHDSATYATDFKPAKCQWVDMSDQLALGIRFFDFRLFIAKNKSNKEYLSFCHGSVDLDVTFAKGLDLCANFLQCHESELIMISIKRERDDDGEKFADMVWREIDEARARYSGDPKDKNVDRFWLKKHIPKLKDVRGKMVLLRRFGGKESVGKGIDATSKFWPDNSASECQNDEGVGFAIQDHYKLQVLQDGDDKISYMKPLLDRARDNLSESILCINFSSAYVLPIPQPWDVARSVNPLLEKYLQENAYGRYGIIPMDFPEKFTKSNELIAKIIRSNKADHPVDGGTYELRPRLAQSSALDVLGKNVNDNADICIWGALSGSNQRWILRDAGDGYFFLHPQHAPDKVLAVANSGTEDGAKIILWHKIPKDDQKWKFEQRENGLFTLSPRHRPNSVLDVFGASIANGSLVKLYHYYPGGPSNNAYAQRWLLVRVG